MSRVHDQLRELRRLQSALGAIHNHLHADDVNAAHEACECAIAGKSVTQPNLSEGDGSHAMDFAAAFNDLAGRYKIRACCVMLLPSATVPNAVSLQLCGDVTACRVVEAQIRGAASTYMGDHQQPAGSAP